MNFLGPGGAPRAGNVLTTLTTRDGVLHARPEGAPLCRCRIQRVAGGFL